MRRRRALRDTLATLAAAALSLWLSACSELSDDPLPPSGPAAKAHPEGWLAEDSAAFHGQAIRAAGWDMTSCQGCHGVDYAGGIVEVSCNTCHARTPQGCTVCHGTPGSGIAPPEDLSGNRETSTRVGAHQAHVVMADSLTEVLSCNDCHVRPQGFADPRHIDVETPGRVEITFGERARQGGFEPVYDSAALSCADTYCHGGGRFGNGVTAVWNQVGTGQAACGTCHALPPAPAPATDHPNVPASLKCSTCHRSVVDDDLNIIDPSLHINGQTDL